MKRNSRIPTQATNKIWATLLPFTGNCSCVASTSAVYISRILYPSRLLPSLLLLFSSIFFISTAVQAASVAPLSPELKERLVMAMADNTDGFDRFDAEVWLVDMSARLSRFLPDEKERLNLLKHLHFEARKANLHPELVLAVIEVESRFDRFAISNAGARGLMQIMPFWLKEIGRPDDNLFKPQTNLRFGCTILRYYLDMEKEDLGPALARYNGSSGSTRYPNKVVTALNHRWYRR